jgi:hypothetical protein
MKKTLLFFSMSLITMAAISQRTTETIDEFESMDGTTGTMERVTVPAGSFLGFHLAAKDEIYTTIDVFVEPSFFGADLVKFYNVLSEVVAITNPGEAVTTWDIVTVTGTVVTFTRSGGMVTVETDINAGRGVILYPTAEKLLAFLNKYESELKP